MTAFSNLTDALARSFAKQASPRVRMSEGNQCIILATMLALIPISLFAFSSLLFLVGASLNFTLAWLVTAVSIVGIVAVARLAGASIRTLLLAAVFVIIAGVASHGVIDISYDGQQYHYDAIRALAAGWNPVRDPFQPATPMSGLVRFMLWPSHYPQAAWRVSATLIAAGFDAETAKLTSLLLAGALGFSIAGIVLRFGFTLAQALVVAVISVGNPVILAQLFTRMNDGMLCICIGLALIFATLWTMSRSTHAALVVIGAIAFATNLKFSAIPLFVMLSLLIVGVSLISIGWRRSLPIAGLLLMGGICGVFIFGAHPYLTNLIHDGHPFYPLMGNNSVDIMTVNRPPSFQDMLPIERNFAALFARTATGFSSTDYELKWPFMVSMKEIQAIGRPDPRLSGFGPLFSGALLFALGAACVMLFNGTHNKMASYILGVAIAIGIISWIMPESWWARYSPQFWWFPVLIGLAALCYPQRLTRYSGLALMAILIVNVGLTLFSAARFDIGGSNAIHRQLAQVSNSHAGPLVIYLGEAHSRLPLFSAASGQPVKVTGELPTGCSPEPLALTETGSSGYCVLAASN